MILWLFNRFKSATSSSILFLVYRIRPHLSTTTHPAHTPSILTSPAPETPLKRLIYRSNFCLMRIILKPTIPCAAMASSHCRQGLSGLEGLRRGHHLQACDLQGPARQHRAVPQRRAAHAGGATRHPHLPHQRWLHCGTHLPADPAPALHHRPHRPAVPCGRIVLKIPKCTCFSISGNAAELYLTLKKGRTDNHCPCSDCRSCPV